MSNTSPSTSVIIHAEKEINMFKKGWFKLAVAFGILAALLIFLGVNFVPRISATSSEEKSALEAAKYAGSDYIERHPSAAASAARYAGSDYIERHPSAAAMPENSEKYDNSDWFERHPSNYYKNSDWVERHPEQ